MSRFRSSKTMALFTALALAGCGEMESSQAGETGTSTAEGTKQKESVNDGVGPPSQVAAGVGRDVRGLERLGPLVNPPLPARGGWGGGNFGFYGGGVIYAVRVRSGSYVDQLTQFCYYVPSGVDNSYRAGDFWTCVGPFGGSGGADRGFFSCPNGGTGGGVIGIQGGSGSYMDRLGVICTRDVNHPDPYSSLNVASPQWGGGGGSVFRDMCPYNSLLSGFSIRAGSYLDQIQGHCAWAH